MSKISIEEQAHSLEWAASNVIRSTKLREQIRAAADTLNELQALREKLLKIAGDDSLPLDTIAEDVVRLLGLPTEPVVTSHGNGKYTAVPKG